MENELVLELPNDLRSIEHAVDYVVQACSSCEETARRLRFNFRVGLSEALANAMLYGNSDDPAKRVRVEVELGPCSITAKITDQGNGFDPTHLPDPTQAANLTKPGGRGIFLMRELMDEVSFNKQGNSVTLVLRFRDEDEDEDCLEIGGGAEA